MGPAFLASPRRLTLALVACAAAVLALPFVEATPIPPGSPAVLLPTSLPDPVYGSGAVWADGAAYVFGGHVAAPGLAPTAPASAQVLRFDPATGTVAALPPLPVPVSHAPAVWTGSAVYVFAGSADGAPGRIVRFDPATGNSSLVAATLPPRSWGLAAAWTGSHVYLFGGSGTCCTVPESLLGLEVGSDAILRFDPLAETLAPVGTLPAPRTLMAAVWDGTAIHLVGGLQRSSTPTPPGLDDDASVLRFDPATGTLAAAPVAWPLGAPHMQAVWDGTVVHLFHGTTIVRYDPAAGTMVTDATALPASQVRTPALFDGCFAYLFGGIHEGSSAFVDGTHQDTIVAYGSPCPLAPLDVPGPALLQPPVPGPDAGPLPPATAPPPASLDGHGHALGQEDSDGDGVADAADNCPAIPNRGQEDADGDGLGDACGAGPFPGARGAAEPDPLAFPDRDLDGVTDVADNCPTVPNRGQQDLDGDGLGDACDGDVEADGVANAADNCPEAVNPRQEDRDADGLGDACDAADVAPWQPARAGAPGRAAAMPDPAPVWPVVAALVAALVALWAALRWLVGPGLVVLFSRLRRSSLLDHPVRDWLVQAVAAQPGIHFRELARLSGHGRGALAHHLRVLRSAGLLQQQRVGQALLFFPPGTEVPGAGRAHAALRAGLARRVAAAVLHAPGGDVPTLAGLSGGKYGAVAYHVRRLGDAGLVRLETDGGRLRAYPADGLAQLVR